MDCSKNGWIDALRVWALSSLEVEKIVARMHSQAASDSIRGRICAYYRRMFVEHE